MKILSIGNSFSQDAHKWLHDIALTDEYELDTVNLYIGGCSLETHWNNIVKNKTDYVKEGNNGCIIEKTSILKVLKSDKFDVITLQQASGFSGFFSSYIPYLINISNYVKKYQHNAKLYLHKTWSYEIDSKHPSFVNYNNNQSEMYLMLSQAYQEAAKIINADIIPVGDVIQSLRENTKEFDYKNGGLSLCRDGFHLSLDYGCFVAAATWYKTLTNRTPDAKKFAEQNPTFNKNLLSVILKHIN